MAHAQKPDFVFRRNGRVHLNRRGSQFSRVLAAEVCASAVVMVVMLDTPCSEVVWRVLATHSIRQFPLHFPSRASPCAITFQLECTLRKWWERAKKDGGGHGELRRERGHRTQSVTVVFPFFNPYPTAFPYGNGMVLHFYQQQESSTAKTVHKVINKGLKAYV